MSDQGSICSSGVPDPQAVLCGNLGPFRDRNTLFSDGSRPQPTPAGSVQLGSPALMKLVWERVVALEFCSPLGCMWCRSSCFEGNLFHGKQTGCCWNSRLMSQLTYWPTAIHKGVNRKPASVHFYLVWMFSCVRKSCEERSGYLILLSIVFWNVKLVE